MPEGHTIHRIARRHRQVFVGKPVRVSSPQGRFGAGAAKLDGRVLDEVEARGKHLLYHWAGRLTLHVHLGLVGKFRTHGVPAPSPSPATRLVLENESAAAFLTGPMHCVLIDRTGVEAIVGSLGPDPLVPRIRITEFARRIDGSTRPVGAVLLDQSIVAGIGNVFRSEILYLCGIDPRRKADALSDTDVECIWQTARRELRRGVDNGRIITVNPRDVGAAKRSQLPERLQRYVYKREHRPCLRCRTPIRMGEIAARKAWWCPSCQPR